MDRLEDLAARRERIEKVRIRTGAEEKFWDVERVDRGGRAVVLRRHAAPSVQRSLFEVDLATVLEWARRARGGLDSVARGVALVAQIPVADAQDLRPLIAAWAAAAASLKDAPGLGAFADRERWRLQGSQDERERNAALAFENARNYVLKKQFTEAYFYLRQLKGADRRLGFTKVYEDNQAAIQEMFSFADAQLANQELAKYLPGAKVSEEGDVTTVLFDFDTDEQRENFVEGLGVLEPFLGPVVTPDAAVNQRLHLLKGMDGLTRDRPLGATCFLDSTQPMSASFDLYTLGRPFLLAVDLDGLHVAVLSADPNHFPEWAFPPDVPTLPKEKKAPTLDGFGRGRGVAFHAKVDFGDIPNWDWKRHQRASKPEEWTGHDDLSGDLFSFLPDFRLPAGKFYRVEVSRRGGRIALSVDGKEIASEERPEWARIGAGRGGSGRIQILTWTPQAIDNLRLSGRVKESWRKERRDEEARRIKDTAAPGGNAVPKGGK
jgi:hypothetical protein